MNNKIQNGQYLSYTNTAGTPIEGGSIVVLDPTGKAFVAVATKHIPAGGTGIVDTEGVYKFPKASGAISLGAAVFIDASGTVSTAGDVYVGRAFADAAAPSPTCLVRINFGSVATTVVSGG